MKFPFFCLPSIRFASGFRSCAVAFFTFVLLGSGEACADLTQAQVQAAFEAALAKYGSDGDDVLWTLPGTGPDSWETLIQYLTVDSSTDNLGNSIARRFELYMSLFWPYIRGMGASSTNLARISSFFPSPGDSQYNLAEFLSQISGSVADVATLVPLLDFRSDSHGNELLVAAPDIEYLLQDVYDLQAYNLGGMYGLMQDIYDDGLLVHGNITISGGQVSVSNQVDVNVLNWPDYFTGEYDQEVAEEITSAPSYESDWDSYVSDTTDYADESTDDASDDSPYFADVTNAVDSVVLDTDEQDDSLTIRDEVFNPISADLIPASAVNRNFSSDVLILPAVSEFNIPQLAWDGNDATWQSFLTRSGSLMASLYDVFYALFVIWLIWREYNFYFRTM